MGHVSSGLLGAAVVFWFFAAIFGGFFALFYVVLPAVIFVAALWEKRPIRSLNAIEGEFPPSPAVDAALAAEFCLAGRYSSGQKSAIKARVTLLLSPDQTTGLLVIHNKLGGRSILFSRFSGEKWLITSSVLSTTDLSGLDDEQMLAHVPLAVLLQFHAERIASRAEEPIPFIPETLGDDLMEHDRRRAQILVDRGLARYRGQHQEAWSFRLGGAARIAAGVWRNMQAARRGPSTRPRAVPMALPSVLPLRARTQPLFEPPSQTPVESLPSDMGSPTATALPPPPLPASTPGSPPDAMEAATLAELDRLDQKKSGWGGTIIILLVSLGLFIAGGRSGGPQAAWNWEFLLLIIPILFVHEAGHYLAMRLFGYRNLRIFFIPFVGAAVTGRQYNVAGWKKAIVSLAGPVPGIILGMGCALAGRMLHQEMLVRGGLLCLLINGLNLLPVLPLDGGWVVHTILFSRHYLLDVGFRVVAAAALFGLSLLLPGTFLQYIAIFLLVSLPLSLKRGRLVDELRRDGFGADSSDGRSVPPETARRILARVRQQSPRGIQPKAAAQHVLAIFESLNARPPGAVASVGFLALHGGSLMMALLFGIALIAMGRPSSRDLAPQYPLTANGVATAGMAPVGDYQTVVARFRGDTEARAAFDQAQVGDGQVMPATLVGRLLLIPIPAADAEARRQCLQRWQNSAVDVFVEWPEHLAELKLSCSAPDQQAAMALESQAKAYLQCVMFGSLTPPWATPEAYPASQQDEDQRMRLLLAEFQRRTSSVNSAQTEAMLTQVVAAQKSGDAEEAKRLQKQMQDQWEQALRAERERIKAEYGDSPLFQAWEQLATKKDAKEWQLHARTQIAPHLGLWPAQHPSGVLAKSGFVQRHLRTLSFSFVRFNHCDAGIPALISWLRSKGCTQFTYQLEAGFVEDDKEPQ